MTRRPLGHDRRGPSSDGGPPPVEIRRSSRRRRTVSARMEGDTFVVLMPTTLTHQQEQEHVENLLARHLRAQSRRRLEREDLMGRATALSERYLGGRARPTSITWVTNQLQRWGSCSPTTGTIRLSTDLERMPTWVVDSVIVHELAHLLEADHGPRFKALVRRYERYDEATTFLKGVAFGMGREIPDDDAHGDLE